ncbi:MAG: precorrin-3B C(17)-methyltransferase, partial [Alphaproteobacteria bacterium]|nr:precorrin-3B C(17)-methyltransferase [Alphaproteobacteria bacterium]
RDIDPLRVGRARGRLDIVGIGPGPADWRTPEASHALRAADAVVGYGLYLDLLGMLIADKPQHARALGEEEARVKLALELAAKGQRVALVSSGDAGIYALATLAHELVERSDDPAWRRLEIHGMPGVSAMQAAAARAGAPLGHDFCAISLSDLLTPIETIEERVRAAIAGDFVVAFYNPASQRRREPFHRALALLRAGRPPATPVIVARNLGREGERVEVVELQALDPDRVDMLTLLIVGSSATRIGPSGVFTPRGYAGKKHGL